MAFSGDITAYGAQPSNQFCGFNEASWNYQGASSTKAIMTAAINAPQMNNSLACGTCAVVTLNSKATVVLLDNICPECKYGDLDLSQDAWKAIVGDTNYGRKKASWEFSECPSAPGGFSKGTVSLRANQVNYWWVAMNPSGMRCGVQSMDMKYAGSQWVPMVRDNSAMNGLWFILQAKDQAFSPPFRFRLKSLLGDTIETDDIASMELLAGSAPLDTLKQFKCSGTIDCNISIPTPAPTPSLAPVPTPAPSNLRCVQ
jgi:expansin (peptidoglycan-binding protein)